MAEEPIPSPFNFNFASKEEMLKEIEALFTKYGYKQFGWFAGKPTSKDMGEWDGAANVISEGMIKYMERTTEWMKKTLEDNPQNDE